LIAAIIIIGYYVLGRKPEKQLQLPGKEKQSAGKPPKVFSQPPKLEILNLKRERYSGILGLALWSRDLKNH